MLPAFSDSSPVPSSSGSGAASVIQARVARAALRTITSPCASAVSLASRETKQIRAYLSPFLSVLSKPLTSFCLLRSFTRLRICATIAPRGRGFDLQKTTTASV